MMLISNPDRVRKTILKMESNIIKSELSSIAFYEYLYSPKEIKYISRKALAKIEKAKSIRSINDAEFILGYSRDEFILHIEKQFTEGMSWDERSKWHLDHIIPINVMIKEGEIDIKKINCLSNLQPIMARENLIKGDRCRTLF